MKVLVAMSDVPFVHGGHRVIAESLTRALREHGVEAEIIRTPQNRFGRQFAAYAATYLTDVGVTGNGEKIDQIITMRFPSYALRHERHVCWLLHRMREYYDLWPEWRGRLSWKGAIKEQVRKGLIHAADRHFLRRTTKLFALSATVQDRLRRWGGHVSEVLHPPPPQRPYRCDRYGDFIFAPSRLAPLKRQHLLVEAIGRTADKGIKAVIAGEGEMADTLAALIRERGLESRCTMAGNLTEDQLLDYYARCRAVFFAPLREDYGFVTPEAFASGKAVITCTDSGGAAELVRDRGNGLIVAPDAEAVAGAIDELAGNQCFAESLGTEGRKTASALTWEHCARKLLLRT